MKSLVLCYHTVGDWPHPMAVPADRLQRHVQLLLDRGYEPMTFSDLVLRASARRQLAVTFDDGFRAVRERALPVLSRLGVPATVFVPTGFVGSGAPMRWDGFDPRPMPEAELHPVSWDDLRVLADSGWEVGSHGVTHRRLSGLDDAGVRWELESSKVECERQLGAECRAIAYPFGDADGRVFDAAERVGYRAGALLDEATTAAGRLATRRVGIYRVDHQLRFRVKVSGVMDTSVGTAVRIARRLVA